MTEMNKYNKRLVELAKAVRECEGVEFIASSEATKFQSRLNHLLGYIDALQEEEDSK